MAENRRKGAGRPKGKKTEWIKGEKDPYIEMMERYQNPRFRGRPCTTMIFDVNEETHDIVERSMRDERGETFWPKIKKNFYNLSDNQLLTLLAVLNKNCLVEAMNVNELKEVFLGKRTAKVKNIGVLAYILKKLAIRGLICADWQHQAESLKMFVSVRNTPIKGNKMASYLSTFEEQIKAYNGKIYKDNIPPTYKAKKELKQEIDDIVDSL